jgi:hypothetical protein
MDKRHGFGEMTQKAITDRIEEKAKSYTPQWKFDRNHPDLGTALAFVYLSMQADTEKNFERLPEKLRTEFFNMLGTSIKPASPAKGYCVFGLVNDESEGTELPAGTALTSSVTDENGEAVFVETVQDVFVTPARIQSVWMSSSKKDYIGCLYEGEEGKEAGGFQAFSMEEENLQCHQLLLSHSHVFAMEKGGELKLRFFEKAGKPVEEEILNLLCDRENVWFEYSAADGFQAFAGQERQGASLCFRKAASQPSWEETEEKGQLARWLRITVKDGRKLKDWVFRDVLAASQASLLEPDSIYGAGFDGGKGPFFPFGEQFGLYDEVYFSSQEALGKRGAFITLWFWREYVKIPLGYTESREIDWKLVMPKSAVKVEREYDITIDRVIWEYFNGSGWVRLFSGRDYENVFGGEGGTYRQKVVLSFFCPHDLSAALVNGAESYSIRARIVKVNNSLKTAGQYVSPVLSEIRFQYQYSNGGVRPEYFVERNNQKERLLEANACLGGIHGYRPVVLMEDEKPSMYLGFQKPLTKGPIKLLAVTECKNRDRQPRLRWEYYGNGRFQEFHPVDETQNFIQTGMITFNGLDDMEKAERFSRECYWIRIVDDTESINSLSSGCKPWIQSLYLNGAPVHTIKSGFQEYFTLEPVGEARFKLMNRPVFSAQVWVNETGRLTGTEREQLIRERRLKTIHSQGGEGAEEWVLWEENQGEQKKERMYQLDRKEGILEFLRGGGRRLPMFGVVNGIHILYSTTAGQAGNLAPGDVTGMERTAGFINRVENPLPLSGGWDKETSEEAIKRQACHLKHKNRAVMPEDFEKLALACAGSVSRAACFTGYGEQGERRPGHVTLVVVQKDFENSSLYFQSLRQRILEYLKDKLPVHLIQGQRFHVAMPVFVEIQVSAQLAVDDFQKVFSCRRRVFARISEFLNPISGNFKKSGWKVGSLPSRSQIDMVLKNTEEVREVLNLMITGCIRNGREAVEVNPEDMRQCPYVLPVSGTHRIRVLAQ